MTVAVPVASSSPLWSWWSFFLCSLIHLVPGVVSVVGM